MKLCTESCNGVIKKGSKSVVN